MTSIKPFVLAAAAVFALGSAPLIAQEPSPSPQPEGVEHHHILAAHHANAQQHAKALHHHASTAKTVNKEIAKEHAEEIGRSVEAAEKHTVHIEQHMTAAEKTAAAAHLTSMHEHHAAALKHHAELTAELNKENPDAAKVKEHAAAIHHHVTAAAASHAAIMKQRNVKPPVTPSPSPSPSDDRR